MQRNATAETLERPVTAPEWSALITGDREPHSAFIRGHRDLFALRTAEDDIIAAFDRLGYGDDAKEILDAAGGAAIQHTWMRVTERDGEIEYFEFCSASADGAFPVTAARFA